MATQPVISETSFVPQERYKFTPEQAAEGSKKGVEAKRLARSSSENTQKLIHKVLVNTLKNGKPSEKLRAALELNRDLGVMRRADQGEQHDKQLDAGIELLSSTAPEPTKYLDSDAVARIRAIGEDKANNGGDVRAPQQVLDQSVAGSSPHPSSQEAGGGSDRVTSSPKFFSASDLTTRLDALDTRISDLSAAVEKLTCLMKTR